MSLPFHHPKLEQSCHELLTILRERSFEQRDVTLSSGKKSKFYIDCKQSSLTARGHVLIGRVFCSIIARVAPNAVAVGGLTLGADPLASAVATMSEILGAPLDAFLIRKEPKGHGTEQFLEGANRLTPNSDVVILEDVVTTGASTIRAIERARKGQLNVRHVIALVDRNEGGRAAVEAHAPLTSLFGKADFVDES